jgi:hypothetical protein
MLFARLLIFTPGLLALLLIACSDDLDDAPGSRQGGADAVGEAELASVPLGPTATLRASGGGSVVGGVGSRCWDGTCVEHDGPVTNTDPLVIGREESFGVTFAGDPPARTASAWVPVVSARAPDSEAIVWKDLTYKLAESEQGAEIFLAPGSYVFVLKATWEDRGDIIYGFYLVRE